MNNYEENNAFGFEPDNLTNDFNYNNISGLGESDYENEDLFNIEISNIAEQEQTDDSRVSDETKLDKNLGYTLEYPIDYYESVNKEEPIDEQNIQNDDAYSVDSNEVSIDSSDNEEIKESFHSGFWGNDQHNSFVETEDDEKNDEFVQINNDSEFGEEVTQQSEYPIEQQETEQIESAAIEESDKENKHEDLSNGVSVDAEFLDSEENFDSASLETDYEYSVVEPTVEINEDTKKEIFTETPIEELNKLTEFEPEKIETTDIKSLFDRVGVNVKEASDIFKKNTEMKEKIDSRFEELKKLQSEVEKAKRTQYDEINAYKEEVLGKLTEKKEEIERRINKLKEFQTSLEKEKEEFEQYRKTEKEEIERVQREIQEAYDSRRDELTHIEDVLRKQKDALDEERSQLSLDRIQYEADKNELANNLLKFNEIVDTFTNGMDKIEKE